MLCESLNNWKRYDFGPTWNEIMGWITDHAATLTQSITVAGCDVRLSEGQTKRLDCCLYESHKKMVDIQMVLAGKEWIYVTSSAGLPYLDPFNNEEDLGFHIIPDHEIARISLQPGVFAMLFPWDAHMPLVAVDNEPAPIKKLVVKIPLEKLAVH